MGIVRVHREAGTTGVFVDEEHLLPRLAAVVGAPDAARMLRTAADAHGADEEVLRIVGIHHDAGDQAGVRQAHVGPGAARVVGFVDTVAGGDAIANHPGFARARPYHRMLGRIDRQRADRLRRLLVEDRAPAVAATRRFPDAARSRADVGDVRVSRHADDGARAISVHRSIEAEAKRLERCCLAVLVILRGQRHDGGNEK